MRWSFCTWRSIFLASWSLTHSNERWQAKRNETANKEKIGKNCLNDNEINFCFARKQLR
jgi:hypothetical protein